MKNITFTSEQLQHFTRMVSDFSEYQGTHDSPYEFENFLEKTFGDDWYELTGNWDNLYEFEFDYHVYLYLATDIMLPELQEWIEEGKQILQQILEEDENE